MGYLYADATPFPLDENFIETLSALTDACVRLFQAHNATVGREQQVREARAHAEVQIRQLDELAKSIEAGLQPFAGLGPGAAAQQTASKIAAASKTALTEAVQKVTATRDATIRTAMAPNRAEEVRKAVTEFFVKHRLPDTSWGVEWKMPVGVDRATGTIIGIAPDDIRLAFEAAIPGSSVWNEALRIADFEPELYVTMSKEPGLLGKTPRVRKEALHKLLVTEVHYEPSKRWLVLHSTTKKPTSGLRIVLQDGADKIPRIIKLDENSAVDGKAERLTGESSKSVQRLWGHVEAKLDALVAMRQTLKSVRHGARNKKDTESPAELAESMLETVAPLVREMRKRSRVPGELALKRELGDGKREELFVPRDELHGKFSSLPESQRRTFEAMGLSNEPTQEFVTSMLTEPLDEVPIDDGIEEMETVIPDSFEQDAKVVPPPPGFVKPGMNLEEALSSADDEPQTREVTIEAGAPDDDDDDQVAP